MREEVEVLAANIPSIPSVYQERRIGKYVEVSVKAFI